VFAIISESSAEGDLPKIVLYIFAFSLFGFMDAITVLASFNDSSIMTIFSVSALFFYAKLIQDYIIIKFDDENTFIENAIIDFIYDNILSYIVSIILFFSYPSISEKIGSIMKVSIRTNGDVIAKVVIGILLAILIIIPAIPYLLYFVTYMFSMELVLTILNPLSVAIPKEAIFIKNLVLIILSIILILGTEYILSGYFGRFIRKIRKKFFIDRFLPEN